MKQVQNGGVANPDGKYIKNAEVRNRSISDQKERELDLREFNRMFTECLWCLENDVLYAEHIYDMQTYLEYCLGRKVNIIPEGWIPRKGHIDRLAYSICLQKIAELLFTTGLLKELLQLINKADYEEEGEGAFIDD